MAHFFPLKELDQGLQCHQNDCGMNVLYFLGIIPRNKALHIADTTDDIFASRIEDFLSDTYGVTFKTEQMWNAANGVLEKTGQKMIELYNKLNEIKLPEQKGVIVFMKNDDYGHFAVIGKIEGKLYFIDPQSGIKHLLLSKETDDIISQTYNDVYVFISDGPATRNKPNLNTFHNALLRNKNYLELLNARGKPHFDTVLKHKAKGVIIHHGQLIKGKKYQVIDKVTEQPINIGIFDKSVEMATFTKGPLTFSVPWSDYKFIRVKQSVGSAKQKRSKWSYKTRKTKSA